VLTLSLFARPGGIVLERWFTRPDEFGRPAGPVIEEGVDQAPLAASLVNCTAEQLEGKADTVLGCGQGGGTGLLGDVCGQGGGTGLLGDVCGTEAGVVIQVRGPPLFYPRLALSLERDRSQSAPRPRSGDARTGRRSPRPAPLRSLAARPRGPNRTATARRP